MSKSYNPFVAELVDLGFETRLRQLYARFEQGEISLGYLAQELGVGLRDAYYLLEERRWPTSNIGAQVVSGRMPRVLRLPLRATRGCGSGQALGGSEYVTVAGLVQTVIEVSGRIQTQYVEGPVGVHSRHFERPQPIAGMGSQDIAERGHHPDVPLD
jgi:hypothetical protein